MQGQAYDLHHQQIILTLLFQASLPAGDAKAEKQLLRDGALALVQPARHPGMDEPVRVGHDGEQSFEGGTGWVG